MELAQTAAGAVTIADGARFVTFFDLVALHPEEFVTFTFRVTGLTVPELHAMEGVPAPASMVPFVIVQA